MAAKKKKSALNYKALLGRSDANTSQVLRLLPRSVLEQMLPALEVVTYPQGATLFEPGDDITHAYFPLQGLVLSLVLPMSDGRSIEAATIGREGAIGGIISLGLAPAFCRATVQIPGRAGRISIDRLEDLKRSKPKLHDILLRYSDCLTAQILQSVACASIHSLEQRCARWLLMTHDRLQSHDLPLTQETLADMFGVARTYVTRVAQKLQKNGAIAYRRGHIHIVQRSVLAKTSCECYGIVKRHYDRVLPGLYPQAQPD